MGPGLPDADRPAVDLDHRNDFGGGAGQKAFVGHVDVVPGQRDFADRDAGRLGQLDHRLRG